MKPTEAQLDYLKYLCKELGYDFENYEDKSREELQHIIGDMKKELG